jgi:hypothetical protein
MTVEEYKKRRKWQDRKDYKRYENAFLGFLVALVLFGIGYGLLGMVLAVLG